MKNDQRDILLKIFKGNRKPFNLPIYKTILAPVEASLFDAFWSACSLDENYEAAIKSYQEKELCTYVLFKEPITNLMLYISLIEFNRVNKIHLNFGPDN